MKADDLRGLAVVLGLLLLAATRPAPAHFLWGEITPAPSPTFRLTFGEGTQDTTPSSLMERILEARAWTADGKRLSLKQGAGALLGTLPPEAKLVGVAQTWGVLNRQPQGRGHFLVRYYAKAAGDPAAAAECVKLAVEIVVDALGPTWVATVRHEGRPVAGAELSLVCPGQAVPVELTTDGAGQARFLIEQPGRCQIRAMVPEWKPGKYHGKTYDLVRHYSTLTFPVNPKPMSAADLLHAVHEMRETWDERFPGFSALIRVEQDGRSVEGTVRVSASGEVEVKLGDTQLQAAAEGMLRSIVAHRRPGTPKYTPTFASADSHPQGRAILLNDQNQSLYRIANGQIRQVNRTMGDSRFTIDILRNTFVEGGRYLPAAFTVTYREATTGRLQRVQSVADRYERVGQYSLPAERRVVTASQDGTSITVLGLIRHRLHPAGAQVPR